MYLKIRINKKDILLTIMTDYTKCTRSLVNQAIITVAM